MQLGERGRGVLLAVVGLCLAGLMAEGGLRLYAWLGSAGGVQLARFDPQSVLYVPNGDLGYRQRPNSVRQYRNDKSASANAMGYRGPLVSPAKPAGTVRVLLIGGSTTHGYGVDDDETIDHHMRSILAERYPGVRIEVVNLALGGYDSFQVRERMRLDGQGLDPDIVIVNSGVNDVRNAKFRDLTIPDRRTLIWEDHLARMRAEEKQGGPSLRTRLKHHLYLARMPGFLRDRLSQREKVHSAREIVEPDPGALDYFETNLRRTADYVDAAGAALVLSTPASALRYREPDETSDTTYWVVDAATTEDYRQQLAARTRALAAELAASGRRVRYVSHDLAPDQFLDDCHLNDAGNRAVAETFADSIEPYVAALLGEETVVDAAR